MYQSTRRWIGVVFTKNSNLRKKLQVEYLGGGGVRRAKKHDFILNLFLGGVSKLSLVQKNAQEKLSQIYLKQKYWNSTITLNNVLTSITFDTE